jgi:hypothetical protein
MVMGNLASVTLGATMVYPGEGFDPLATLQTIEREKCTALYGVPTMFIAELDHPGVFALRPEIAAYRHHGRRALPGRGDEARQQRDEHGRGDDRLWHDRNLAGEFPERD